MESKPKQVLCMLSFIKQAKQRYPEYYLKNFDQFERIIARYHAVRERELTPERRISNG